MEAISIAMFDYQRVAITIYNHRMFQCNAIENRHVARTSWLVVSTPLKNMKVSWDDDIPNIWKNEIHILNHQPASINRTIWDIEK